MEGGRDGRRRMWEGEEEKRKRRSDWMCVGEERRERENQGRCVVIGRGDGEKWDTARSERGG